MSTITKPPRPPIPAHPREPVGNRPLPRGVVGLAQRQAGQGPAIQDSAPEGTLIVGRDIYVKGRIEDCRALVVEGHVEAAVKAERLEVRKGGTFVGSAEIARAEIAGRFEGTLKAGELLNVAAGGRVRGEIRYAQITIEAGGEIAGDIDTAAAATARDEASKEPALAVTGA